MGDEFETTTLDESISTETPILVLDKLNDSVITETASSTSTPETLNTPPIIKEKFPKLATTAGKPLK